MELFTVLVQFVAGCALLVLAWVLFLRLSRG